MALKIRLWFVVSRYSDLKFVAICSIEYFGSMNVLILNLETKLLGEYFILTQKVYRKLVYGA